MTGAAASPRPKVAADRVALPVSMQVVIIVATAVSVGLAARTVPVDPGESDLAFLGGALAGSLGVAALRSVSIRTATRWMCVVGALLVVRFGTRASGDAAGVSTTLGWVAATTVALVLAARSERWMWRRPVRVEGAGSGGSRRLARIVVVMVCLAGAAGIGLGPSVANRFNVGASSGDVPSAQGSTAGSALAATRRLDMTRRPRLTDAVVLSVRSPRGGFLRSQTFDVWDGQGWTRSDAGVEALPDSGRVRSGATDLAASQGTVVRQEIHVAASFVTALPAAPSAVAVDASVGLVQWEDGSIGARAPLGRGSTYTVESRQRLDLTPALLRATADAPTPDAVLDRYAGDPEATARVAALAREITAGAVTPYEKADAIESWLDANTTYSLDAPLAPRDADVVDDFLFESRVGWCEQIASSFTVLLRLSGVPARVATGYVATEVDPVTRTYTVRERDGHAWTEIWFPEVGWVPFDPTAGVPLSGPIAGSGVAGAVARYGAPVLLAVALVVAAAVPVAGAVAQIGRAWASWRRRRQAIERAPGDAWSAVTEQSLERVGVAWGRSRSPAETATVYARDVGGRVGDPRLGTVGEVIDRARFSDHPPDDEERRAVESLLASVPPEPPRS